MPAGCYPALKAERASLRAACLCIDCRRFAARFQRCLRCRRKEAARAARRYAVVRLARIRARPLPLFD